MKCWLCNKEMKNTIGGCYECECGFGINDGVLRTSNVQTLLEKEPNNYLQGWGCPKCGAVLSPYTDYCPFCAPSKGFIWNDASSDPISNFNKTWCHTGDYPQATFDCINGTIEDTM